MSVFVLKRDTFSRADSTSTTLARGGIPRALLTMGDIRRDTLSRVEIADLSKATVKIGKTSFGLAAFIYAFKPRGLAVGIDLAARHTQRDG